MSGFPEVKADKAPQIPVIIVQKPLPEVELDTIRALSRSQVIYQRDTFQSWLQAVSNGIQAQERLPVETRNEEELQRLQFNLETSDARWQALQARAAEATFLQPVHLSFVDRIVGMTLGRLLHL